MNDDTSVISRRQMLRSVATATTAIVAMPGGTVADAPSSTIAEQHLPETPPTPLASLADFEKAAREKMTPMAYEYVSGGAADEHTLGWNESAFRDIKLRSRVLVDVSQISTSVRIFGREFPHPILLAPTAYHKIVHPDGEAATARGAAAARAAMIVSSFATVNLARPQLLSAGLISMGSLSTVRPG